jgi:hypothetical protein
MARRPTEVIDMNKVIPSKEKACPYCGWRPYSRDVPCEVCGFSEDRYYVYFPEHAGGQSNPGRKYWKERATQRQKKNNPHVNGDQRDEMA